MSSVILVTTIFVIVHRLADGLSLPADQFISSASIEFKGTSDTLDNQVQSRQSKSNTFLKNSLKISFIF